MSALAVATERRRLTVAKPPDRGDWLRARHPYFNASSAAVLYGTHPFQTAADYAVEKLLADPPDDPPTDPMDRGLRLEPVLLRWLGDQLGVTVVTPDVLYVHGRLMATLDGHVASWSRTFIEAKSFGEVHDTVPTHVYRQVCAQAAATGMPECWVVWIDPDMAFKRELVIPARGDVADVLERAEEWMAWIDLGMTPEGVELTTAHVKTLHPKPAAGSFVELDDDGLAAVVEWEQLRRARLAAEKAEAPAKDVVARLVGDKAEARYDGHTVFTWKAAKESPRTDHPAAAAKYLTAAQLAEFTRPVPGARTMRATKELAL